MIPEYPLRTGRMWLAVLLFVVCTTAFFILTKKAPVHYKYTCGVSPQFVNQESRDSTVKLVFDPPYRWNKKVLNVFFVDTDDYNLVKRTLKIANRWGDYAQVKFEHSKSRYESDIRVSFREERGYLSVVGNIAEHEDNYGIATLWLQALDTRSEEEFERVVLHEFGHALALQHELQSPNANIHWDTAAVYNFYDTAYHWKREDVDANIFTPITTSRYTRFDPNSIMIYAVPAFLLKRGPAIEWPKGLSSIDKKTIKKYYP